MSICPVCIPSQLGGSAGWACAALLQVLNQVILPSFCSNLLNLLIFLSITSKYLGFLTLSTNSWHCSKEVVEIMDASLDLHKSLCLALLSRRLKWTLP